MAEQWFSISEYARRFSLSDMTVRRRIKTGRIHAVLKDGKYFIPASDSQSRGVPMHEDEVYEKPRQTQKSHPQHMDQGHLYRNQPQAHAVPHSQIQLIKGQPQHQLHQAQQHQPQQHYIPPPPVQAAPPAPAPRVNTEHLERALQSMEHKLDQAMAMLSQVEAIAAAKYEARAKSLESDLRYKEREVKELLQQNEDLKLLLKFVEKKVPGMSIEKTRASNY